MTQIFRSRSYLLLAEEVINKEKNKMAVKRNGLGKGLDSLIPNKTVKTTEKQANKTQKEKVKVENPGRL